MREKNGSPPTFLPPPQSEEAEFNLVCQLRPWPGKSPGTAPLHSQGPVQVGVAVRIIRAGETVDARSTPGAAAVAIDDTGETQKAAPTVFGNQDAIAQRASPGLASDCANRHTFEAAAAATPASGAKPTHPSPSAHEFRLLLNGLPTPALRRMFCSCRQQRARDQHPRACDFPEGPRGPFFNDPTGQMLL